MSASSLEFSLCFFVTGISVCLDYLFLRGNEYPNIIVYEIVIQV